MKSQTNINIALVNPKHMSQHILELRRKARVKEADDILQEANNKNMKNYVVCYTEAFGLLNSPVSDIETIDKIIKNLKNCIGVMKNEYIFYNSKQIKLTNIINSFNPEKSKKYSAENSKEEENVNAEIKKLVARNDVLHTIIKFINENITVLKDCKNTPKHHNYNFRVYKKSILTVESLNYKNNYIDQEEARLEQTNGISELYLLSILNEQKHTNIVTETLFRIGKFIGYGLAAGVTQAAYYGSFKKFEKLKSLSESAKINFFSVFPDTLINYDDEIERSIHYTAAEEVFQEIKIITEKFKTRMGGEIKQIYMMDKYLDSLKAKIKSEPIENNTGIFYTMEIFLSISNCLL